MITIAIPPCQKVEEIHSLHPPNDLRHCKAISQSWLRHFSNTNNDITLFAIVDTLHLILFRIYACSIEHLANGISTISPVNSLFDQSF